MGYREAILGAATKLFHEQGFSRTTTDEIAQEANITKRTLYRYMSSKEAVLLAIHERFLERLLAPFELHGTTIEQFAALIDNYVETVVAHRNEIRVFFEERKHLSPANLAAVVERRDAYEQVFRDALTRGMDEGLFRRMDVSLVTEAILGAIASLYEWYRPDGPIDPPAISRLIARMFLDGLSATRSDDRPSLRAGRDPSGGGPIADIVPDLTWTDNPVLTHVLDVAAEMFYERGYEKSSTRELAEAAGLGKSALYYYIPNKEAVLYQLSLRLTVTGIESIKTISKGEVDPVEALRRIFVWQCTAISKNLGALRALSYEMRFLDPAHYERIKALRSEYTRLFRIAVQAACGDSRDGAISHAATTAVMGMLNFMNQWYTPGGRLTPEQIGESFFDLIWGGLRR